MRKIITSDDILGKEAIDTDGEILGVVVKLHINSETQEIVGITVDAGFTRPDLFVGSDYIKSFGVDAVLLNTVPVDRYKGLLVLTEEGSEVGRVKDIVMDGKKMSEVVIEADKNFFSQEKINVPASEIKEIGNSVILKKGFKEVD